jgi:hypothetical protein
MKKLLLIVALSSVMVWAAARRPAPEILGIRLGMSYDAAHSKLGRIGQFKSEDEGQQVWLLKHDLHYQYAIVGFDRDRKVRYVTVLVHPEGQPVSYEDVGDLGAAARFGQPGNLRYTWTLRDKRDHFEYVATVKGKDPHHLDRYSIKRLGVQQEEDKD